MHPSAMATLQSEAPLEAPHELKMEVVGGTPLVKGAGAPKPPPPSPTADHNYAPKRHIAAGPALMAEQSAHL